VGNTDLTSTFEVISTELMDYVSLKTVFHFPLVLFMGFRRIKKKSLGGGDSKVMICGQLGQISKTLFPKQGRHDDAQL
jgi:hypothetical protein